MHKRWHKHIIPSHLSPKNTLSAMKKGQTGRVRDILGGWHLRQSLHQVGIHIGDSFLVTRGTHLGGPMVIEINSAQIALGHGMSKKIVVTIDENEPAKRPLHGSDSRST